MLSKNKIKFIQALSDKKNRLESRSFLIEGEKMVRELFQSGFNIQTLIISAKFINDPIFAGISSNVEIIEASENELERISTQKTPQGMMAVVSIPDYYFSDKISFSKNLEIALYDIQDPGNLGTIIRTADWFGVNQIVCHKQTVDLFNPKVIQSTMGAIFRVHVKYTDLPQYIAEFRKKNDSKPVIAAVLDGKDIYKTTFLEQGILMMGNESKGLSGELIKLATHKISIPRFGSTVQQTESLNVAVATAIILSELKRKLKS
jgi:RNA methyltransferase, TrmH family